MVSLPPNRSPRFKPVSAKIQCWDGGSHSHQLLDELIVAAMIAAPQKAISSIFRATNQMMAPSRTQQVLLFATIQRVHIERLFPAS